MRCGALRGAMRLPLPMMLVLALLLSARWAHAHQQASPAGGPDLDEIDHDFSDEIDPTGVSPYLNMLPAEAGRDRHAIRTVKPKRVPVRPKGKLEWVKLPWQLILHFTPHKVL